MFFDPSSRYCDSPCVVIGYSCNQPTLTLPLLQASGRSSPFAPIQQGSPVLSGRSSPHIVRSPAATPTLHTTISTQGKHVIDEESCSVWLATYQEQLLSVQLHRCRGHKSNSRTHYLTVCVKHCLIFSINQVGVFRGSNVAT